MSNPPVVNVIQGFSTTNRWLLYTSLFLSPAQAVSGLGSQSPTGLGFLAFNVYQQYTWYIAARDKQLHALSILPVYLNMTYSLTYLFGIPSGNIAIGGLQGIGSAALIIMNTISAWTSWKTNMPEGYGVYQFYFFGWRTLSKGWRRFFVIWQISDTLESIIAAIAAIALGFIIPLKAEGEDGFGDSKEMDMISFWGTVAALVVTWPLILWTELIVKKNNIVSETDMISVYLFIAQVVTMVGPRVAVAIWEALVSCFGCTRWSLDKEKREKPVLPTVASTDTPGADRASFDESEMRGALGSSSIKETEKERGGAEKA